MSKRRHCGHLTALPRKTRDAMTNRERATIYAAVVTMAINWRRKIALGDKWWVQQSPDPRRVGVLSDTDWHAFPVTPRVSNMHYRALSNNGVIRLAWEE